MTVTNRVNAAWRCSLDQTLEGSQVISSHSNVPGEIQYPVTGMYLQKFNLSPVHCTIHMSDFSKKVIWCLVVGLPNFALSFKLGESSDIYILQVGQIHVAIWTNTLPNFALSFELGERRQGVLDHLLQGDAKLNIVHLSFLALPHRTMQLGTSYS